MASVADLVRAASSPGAAAIRPAARLMTLVADEPSRLPEVYQATAALEEPGRLLLPRLLLGVTGAPGSGKSTLTDALIREYRRRFSGRRIGVVAVDPSSPFTGGAVLGDRVRMMRHATDPMVFVRSMASRGHLGGLALGVKGVIRIMGLIGCDVVFIETVGVGQSEVEVAGAADTTLVLLAPGMGDGVQAAKAGILEIGDVFVVNKADREGADTTMRELRHMLTLGSGPRSGPADDPWTPAVVKTVASRGEGVDDVLAAIDAHRAWLERTGVLAQRRQARAAGEIEAIALADLRARMGDLHGDARLSALAARVAAGELDPYRAADTLVAGLGV